MSIVEEKLRDHYTNTVTYKNAINRVKKIAKDLNCKCIDDLLDVGPQLIINHIKTMSAASRAINIHQIKTMFKLMEIPIPDEISKACDEFTKQKNKVYIEHRKKPLNNSIDIDNIYQFFYNKCFEVKKTTIIKKNKSSQYKVTTYVKPRYSILKSIRLVIFSILRDRCVRLSDLVNMKFEDDGNNNYIDVFKHTMIIRNDKTSRLSKKKKYEDRVIKLSEDTVRNIKYFRLYCLTDYLIPNYNKTDSVTLDTLKNTFNTSMKLYCKENNIPYVAQLCGIHELRRHEVKKDIEGIDMEQLLKIQEACQARGHTLQTMLNHYTRLN